MSKMQIVMKNVDELIRYDNNPRDNVAAIDYVANSISEFDFKVPILIDKNNVIIAGHTRLEAAIALGWEEVPCIVGDDMTDEQVKKFRLIDNKTSEWSKWDYEKLQEELGNITFVDMEQFGFMELSKPEVQKEHKEKVKADVGAWCCCPRCKKEFLVRD